jgi:EAL domain-containing protein (putative c-di-GMP-specific phosphodiesterase class I)
MRTLQWSVVGIFTAVGLATLLLPVGRTELRSEILHVPYIAALAGGAAVTSWGTWVRFRMDGTSRAWLLSAAFGVLALFYLPHALYDSGGADPVGFFYGPASRLTFGILLILAMSPMPVPQVVRRPRMTALLLGLLVIAMVDVVLHADWVQALLEPDPRRANQLIETAALGAMLVALGQFFVKWLKTRRRIMITWIAGVGAVAIGSALMIPTSGWELRWWWAHLGLLVASVVFVLGTDRQMARAIDERELALVYQPKMALDRDEMIGVEALLRWNHPDHGLVPAGDFIPKAEETDLITPFTFWAIREATAQHKRWKDQGLTIPIAVNVTARILRDGRLLETIREELANHELGADAISLELTESKALESEPAAVGMLNELAEIGLCIAVDDFGTGYSSLSYLRNLPVKELKLDRSFVAPMAESEHDYTIVKSTLQMAQGLGLKVVAEGIEDEQVATMLNELHCDIGQGYYWSKPLPAGELFSWAQARTAQPRSRGGQSSSHGEGRPGGQPAYGPVARSDDEARPPHPRVEDGEGAHPEAGAVEQSHSDRAEQPAPLPGDLPPRGENGQAGDVGQQGQTGQDQPTDRAHLN